jgi:hypothetical protein
MTRASQKSRDIARKHRVRRKKLEEKTKGLRQAGPALTLPSRSLSPSPARPAASGPRAPAPAGRPARAPATRAARPARAPVRQDPETPAPQS